MALINCVDCGKQISDQAPICPQCGAQPARGVLTIPLETDKSHVRPWVYLVFCAAYVVYVSFISSLTQVNLMVFIAVTLAIWLPNRA